MWLHRLLAAMIITIIVIIINITFSPALNRIAPDQEIITS